MSRIQTSDLKHAVLVGEIVVGLPVPQKSLSKYWWDTKIEMKYDAGFDKKSNVSAAVYFILVDGEIVKIGQTQAGVGFVHGTLPPYLRAGFDSPSPSRFAINYLMREAIQSKKKVEFYVQYGEPQKVPIRGIWSESVREVSCGGKEMEVACLKDYKKIYGVFPSWNFQERGEKIPLKIQEDFNTYKSNKIEHNKKTTK